MSEQESNFDSYQNQIDLLHFISNHITLNIWKKDIRISELSSSFSRPAIPSPDLLCLLN